MSSDTDSPRTPPASVHPDDFRQAMRRVSSPVAVVTSRHGKHSVGLTATAICSATTEPPTILVCVNQNASATGAIAASRKLAVNFLSEEQHSIARLFSTSGLESERRFAEGEWSESVTGAPVLRGSVASFDCLVDEVIACGTHNIFVSRVVASAHTEAGTLLYRDGFFRRLDENF